LHRIENALAYAGVSDNRAKNIERFLLRVNANQSQGLPVGPNASVILAELCMNDVDTFLLQRGVQYVRFVDDFRIFCGDRRDAVEIIHDLTEYLYTAHRLSLESSKTRIITTEKFLQTEAHDPVRQEMDAKSAKMKELIKELSDLTGYSFTSEDVGDEDKVKVAKSALRDLFGECLNMKTLYMPLARYVLRRAYTQKTAVIRKQVLDDLDRLVPVWRDVARYLMRCTPKPNAAETGARLIEWLEKSPFGGLALVRAWIIEIGIQRPDILPKDFMIAVSQKWVGQLGVRASALIARQHKQVSWIKAHKETWKNHKPWDRRAIIWAGAALPQSERKNWLAFVRDNADNLLDRAVAERAAQ